MAKTRKTKKKGQQEPKKLGRSSFDVKSYKNTAWPNEKSFLESNELSKTELQKANISWQELASIYFDHQNNMESLQALANTVAQMLQQNAYVNSIRTRVKTPRSLIKKITRKRIELKNITLENYKKEISDLVGVRVLHVLKTEWLPIHTSIVNTFKLHNDSNPVAYITRNDELLWGSLYSQNGCLCELNDREYKSVHYDIEIGFIKETTRLEIQVRTINEEAWGELDHKINYPTPAIKVVGDLIRATNMLSSTADQFSQQIIRVNMELCEMEKAQKKLKSERDTALQEARLLMSKLAKTKRDKKAVEKALNDLENSSGAQPIISSLSNEAMSYFDSKPLSLNLNSPTLENKINAIRNLYVSFSDDNVFTCMHCGNPLHHPSTTRVCSDCFSKGRF